MAMRKKRSPGRPVSTGSRSTPVVSFRIGSAPYAALARIAKRDKLSPNIVAKALLEAALDNKYA